MAPCTPSGVRCTLPPTNAPPCGRPVAGVRISEPSRGPPSTGDAHTPPAATTAFSSWAIRLRSAAFSRAHDAPSPSSRPLP
eukprot:1932510-Prymnesium_polylepis.1